MFWKIYKKYSGHLESFEVYYIIFGYYLPFKFLTSTQKQKSGSQLLLMNNSYK